MSGLGSHFNANRGLFCVLFFFLITILIAFSFKTDLALSITEVTNIDEYYNRVISYISVSNTCITCSGRSAINSNGDKIYSSDTGESIDSSVDRSYLSYFKYLSLLLRCNSLRGCLSRIRILTDYLTLCEV